MPPAFMQGNEWSRETGAAVQAGSGGVLQAEVSVGGVHVPTLQHAVLTPSTGQHAFTTCEVSAARGCHLVGSGACR